MALEPEIVDRLIEVVRFEHRLVDRTAGGDSWRLYLGLSCFDLAGSMGLDNAVAEGQAELAA